MTKKEKDLRQKLGELNETRIALLDEVDKRGDGMTAEEQENWEALNQDMSDIESQLQDIEDLREKREAAEQKAKWLKETDGPTSRNGREDSDQYEDRSEVRAAISAVEQRLHSADDPVEKRYFELKRRALEKRAEAESPLYSKEYTRAFEKYLRGEAMTSEEERAFSFGTAAEGGHTVDQERFLPELIMAVDNAVPVRTLSRVIQVTDAASLGVPFYDRDVETDPTWTSELDIGAEDTSTPFDKRTLTPVPLAKFIKVSRKLIRASAINMTDFVAQRLGQVVGETEDTAFNTGSGSNQPLGLFTKSASGITGTQDVDVGDGSAGLSADGIIDLRHNLRAGYNLRWLLHRTVLAGIRKLKGSDNNYLWQPGLAQGPPATLLDLPYTLDEQSPGTIGDGNYVILIGDFRFYWIVEALNMELIRLDELYAGTNQVGFLIRREVDAMPVLADAFRRGYIDTAP